MIRAKFFETLLEEKKFSIFGLGMIRLAYSCGKEKEKIKVETGAIVGDVNSKSNRDPRQGILRCDEKELEKKLGI